ncbi:hypothetical protein V8G54_027300 [Vigna mungo]|uniref:Uncharacterized protein n=1 Tax=Vigna mungo TaxID=3915 RepID=A0AAQ3RR91_VIGMU
MHIKMWKVKTSIYFSLLPLSAYKYWCVNMEKNNATIHSCIGRPSKESVTAMAHSKNCMPIVLYLKRFSGPLNYIFTIGDGTPANLNIKWKLLMVFTIVLFSGIEEKKVKMNRREEVGQLNLWLFEMFIEH